MPTNVYHGDNRIGTIHDLVRDGPNWFGRWEPVTPEVDEWLRAEAAKDAELIIVRLDGKSDVEHYISRLDGADIELQRIYSGPVKWWQFWIWSGLCDM
jgi:hypothetical protein